MDLRRLSAIVFDVDGTLYRQSRLRRTMMFRLLGAAVSRPGQGMAVFRALRAYRRAQEILREMPVSGGLAAAHLRLACQHSGQSEEVLAPIVARWMDQEPLAILGRCVEPNLRRLLVTARERGLRLGIFSDYPALAKLEAMRLSEFFEVVVSAQDDAVNRFKPHPAGLLVTLKRLGAEPRETLYVGDRHDVDLPAARAAGIPCIIIGRGAASGQRGRPVLATDGYASVNDYDQLYELLFSRSTAS